MLYPFGMRVIACVVTAWLCASISFAAGSVLTLAEAEALFTKNNFNLIAQNYGVEIEKALIIQEKLWDNPELSVDQNIYNKSTKKYFDTTATGQSQVSITQLIYLAGQKGKAGDVATFKAKSKEEDLYDLVRRLKLELRSNYFQYHYKMKILEFYAESLDHLEKTLETAEKNFSAGYITLTEVMRIRSMVFSIESERKTLVLEVKKHSEDLKVLLGGHAEDFQTEIAESYEVHDYRPDIGTVDSSMNKAYEARPDLRSIAFLKKAEKYNLNLEKARAIPNLRLGGTYDRQSNYIKDYYGLLISFEIPIFDRNQGNIAASSARLKSFEAQEKQLQLELEREIRMAHTRATENIILLKKYKGRFRDGFEKLTSILNSNYQKKYISVLEFSDSFEALRNSVTQYLLLKAERLESLEHFNYAVGKEIVSLSHAPEDK